MSLALIIYLIWLINGLGIISGIIFCLSVIVAAICVLNALFNDGCDWKDEQGTRRKLWKATRKSIVIAIIFAFLSTIIPDESTMYKMLLADKGGDVARLLREKYGDKISKIADSVLTELQNKITNVDKNPKE